jgi:CspA family cold shock protein
MSEQQRTLRNGTPLETGTVRFYRPEREFGFIAPDNGAADVFVHARTLQMSSIETLNAGDRVEYERVDDRRGYQAYRLRVLEAFSGTS